MNKVDILVVGDFSNPAHDSLNSLVQDIWFNTEHPAAGAGPLTHDTNQAGPAPTQLQLSENDLPAVIFIETRPDGQQYTINRLTGGSTSAQIKSAYQYALNQVYGNGNGNTPTPNEQSGLPVGLGIFDFSIPDFLPQLPDFMYALIGMLCIAGAIKTKNTALRGVYIIGAVLCAAKLVKSKLANYG
jgi:hypothetical protein